MGGPGSGRKPEGGSNNDTFSTDQIKKMDIKTYEQNRTAIHDSLSKGQISKSGEIAIVGISKIDEEQMTSKIKNKELTDDEIGIMNFNLHTKEAEARNEGDRLNKVLMNIKSKYGAKHKTYKGIEKDPEYSKTKIDMNAAYAKRDILRENRGILERAWKASGRTSHLPFLDPEKL